MPNWKVWPSPPHSVHAFQVELVVCDLVGLPLDGVSGGGSSSAMVQVQWSGGGRRPAFIRAVEKNYTALQRVRSDGAVSWWEGFRHECKLKMAADAHKGFKSWIVKLEIHGFGEISKYYSSSILGKTQLDVSAFAALGEERSMISVPVRCSARGFSAEAELRVALEFSDARTTRAAAPSTIARVLSLRRLSRPRDRADTSSANRPVHPSAAGSPSEDETELNNGKAVAGGFPLVKGFGRRLENGQEKKMERRRPHGTRHLSRTQSFGKFLSWTKGKLGSRSARYRKEGPLLYEEFRNGGADDTDHYRRAEPTAACSSNSTPPAHEHDQVLGFEEEGQFEIGSWEERTVASRDSRLELVTQVFLASIDQRSEKAAGESACSVLAAVIADWLHRNRRSLPLRCQFDELVRDGSSEWRRLCADEARMEQFSDRHFDLDTVLGAKVRPLAVVTGMSYVGFLGIETSPDQAGFGCLDGAMSFDAVWEELLCAEAGEERVYIAGWNDHFFVLKVEEEAVYLVDTLGERLFEGCNQAYILKFDRESKVYKTSEEEEPISTTAASMEGGAQEQRSTSGSPAQQEEGREEEVGGRSVGKHMVCEGLGACKEFIKGFLAGVPLRELRGDMERGLVEETQLHRLLQIEFHYTCPL
ncbi:hypothetical protein Taro_049301 [Colocasia esculenta]|uniref:C2 NT-type domain-containing protein n=1 Tax=Colocasia esculenta TaxID=4460 RepID=A0A843XAL0_COLES|nr:hypothetical protein [Colocasia esculenta]